MIVKKIAAVILAGCCFGMTAPEWMQETVCITASATTDVYDDQDVQYRLDTSKDPATATVIGAKNDVTEITIPKTVLLWEAGVPHEATVTDISFAALEGHKTLEKIVIEAELTIIQHHAFRACENLTTVVFPSTLITIDPYAFQGCTSLKNVYIPDAVKSIRYDAFNGCSSLTSIVLPDSVEIIETDAFSDCTSLTSVRFPNNPNFTKIGTGAFSGDTSLTSVDIPASVTEIVNSAFKNCTSLSQVNIAKTGDSLTIGNDAFHSCPLKEINLWSRVSKIDNRAFANCNLLEDVYIYNPSCNIFSWYDTLGGVDNNSNGSRRIVIHGYTGSTADTYVQDYAANGTKSGGKDHGYVFETLGIYGAEPALITGDFDGDGMITAADAQAVLRVYLESFVGGSKGMTDAQFTASDIDGDGRITSADAQLILRYYLNNSVANIPTTWDQLLHKS